MDITVLGGLPVTVTYTIAGAEPDVGIMSSYVDEWTITHIAGRKCKKEPQWLYNRILASRSEEDEVLRKCEEDSAERGDDRDFYPED